MIRLLDKLINGEISVTKLSGWKKKLKHKANCIALKKMAKTINYKLTFLRINICTYQKLYLLLTRINNLKTVI